MRITLFLIAALLANFYVTFGQSILVTSPEYLIKHHWNFEKYEETFQRMSTSAEQLGKDLDAIKQAERDLEQGKGTMTKAQLDDERDRTKKELDDWLREAYEIVDRPVYNLEELFSALKSNMIIGLNREIREIGAQKQYDFVIDTEEGNELIYHKNGLVENAYDVTKYLNLILDDGDSMEAVIEANNIDSSSSLSFMADYERYYENSDVKAEVDELMAKRKKCYETGDNEQADIISSEINELDMNSRNEFVHQYVNMVQKIQPRYAVMKLDYFKEYLVYIDQNVVEVVEDQQIIIDHLKNIGK